MGREGESGATALASRSPSRRSFLRGGLLLLCGPPVYRALAGCGPVDRGAAADADRDTAGDASRDAVSDISDGRGDAADASDARDTGEEADPRVDDAHDGGADSADMEEPDPDAPVIDGWRIPEGATLAGPIYALLAATMDALIPGDDEHAGAHEANAAWYLDQLLGAFRTDPPRIFAGGPYSGRHTGLDGFRHFQRLTRVEEIGWRTVIEGSLGIPEREFNGPVNGLTQIYEEGLAALDREARSGRGRRFTALDLANRRQQLMTADPEFVSLAYEHAVEGTYGDPVYGGNRELRGWRAIGFEGDRQPRGYSAREMLFPEEG